MTETRKKIIEELRRDILLAEGFKPHAAGSGKIAGLETIESAFPNGIFPVGAIHEFLAYGAEQAAASGGFVSGVLSSLMQQSGVCVWISAGRMLFPLALKAFGIDPHNIIFIDLKCDKEVLWTIEEALKCNGITAVVGEVRALTFMQSRRLQLAVESSNVTGFILRTDKSKISTTACTARWQITPIASQLADGMPGVGFPRWQVDLLKVRNGKPGSWQVEWAAGQFNVNTETRFKVVFPGERKMAG